MELHFEEYGQGEPLIILHGLLGSLDNWRPASRRLGEYFRVFALDQRNHGGSPHSSEMNYPTMAEDVRQFLKTHGLTDAFVMGHSMGGKTAMQLALLYPEAIRKLVIVDIAPRSYPPTHQRLITGMLSLDLNHFESRKDMEAALAPAVPDLFTRQFLLKNVARDSHGAFHWKIGLEQIQQNYAHLAASVVGDGPFEKPALFLRGEKSDYLLESDLSWIRRLFPRTVLKTIPGAGHLLHVENPNAFLAVVLEFLRERELLA